MKACSRCSGMKPPGDFYKDLRSTDGLYSHCKACHIKGTSKWKSENREAIRSAEAARFAADPGPFRENGRRYRERHATRLRARRIAAYWSGPKPAIRKARYVPVEPHIKAARDAVYQAVKSGTLAKPGACPRCERRDVPIQGHHHDYTKRLDVDWLCKWCHEAEHHGTADLQIRPAA